MKEITELIPTKTYLDRLNDLFINPNDLQTPVQIDFLAVSDKLMDLLRDKYNLTLIDWFYHLESKDTKEDITINKSLLRVIPDHGLHGLAAIVSINNVLYRFTSEEGKIYDLLKSINERENLFKEK